MNEIAKTDTPNVPAMPIRKFEFREDIESFVITDPVTEHAIFIPRIEVIQKTHIPNNYLTIQEDGTKVSVRGENYSGPWGDREMTFSNREAGWMAHAYKNTSQTMALEDEDLRGSKAMHFLNPETYVIRLFDFRAQAQFYFSGTVLDHPGIRRKEKLSASPVEGTPIEGWYFGHNFIKAEMLPAVEERFLADFEQKYPRCQQIEKQGFFSTQWNNYGGGPSLVDSEEGIVFQRGTSAKGDPLITVETYFKQRTDARDGSDTITGDWIYEEPRARFEFFGRAEVDKPVFQTGPLALYKTMGGIVIEDQRSREHYYILQDAQVYIRARSDFATAAAKPAYFDIADLAPANWGRKGDYCRYSHSADGTSNSGQLRWQIEDLAKLAADLDKPGAMQAVFSMACMEKMPRGERSLYERENQLVIEELPNEIDVSELRGLQLGGFDGP